MHFQHRERIARTSLQFTLSSSDIEQVNQLSFSIDGITTHNFDLAFGDVFKEFGGLFAEIFEPIQGIVNILVATLNFSIRMINKMKKCNLLYIKSTPIRVRFRDTITKLMEISLLSLQFMNPMVFFNPFAFGNYLYNINVRLVEVAKIKIGRAHV